MVHKYYTLNPFTYFMKYNTKEINLMYNFTSLKLEISISDHLKVAQYKICNKN